MISVFKFNLILLKSFWRHLGAKPIVKLVKTSDKKPAIWCVFLKIFIKLKNTKYFSKIYVPYLSDSDLAPHLKTSAI